MTYYEQTDKSTNVHPVLVIGIIIFVAPFLLMVIKFNLPSWISIIGVVIMFIGAMLTIKERIEE